MTEIPMLSGFGNEFATEAVAGALPQGQNSPQRPPLGLYTEQISGTPFTVPRREARRTWLYRIRPSAVHPAYRRIDNGALVRPARRAHAQPAALGSAADAAGGGGFHLRPVHPGRRGGGAHGRGLGASVPRQPADAPRVLERRRRAADRAAAGPPVARHRTWPPGRGAGTDRGDPPRGPLPGRPAGSDRARLHLREPRRGAAPARPRPDRRQWPRQPARLPRPRGLVRGPRRTDRAGAEIPGRAVGHHARPLAARRGGVARQPGAVHATILPASWRSTRSASTIPTRRSSPC